MDNILDNGFLGFRDIGNIRIEKHKCADRQKNFFQVRSIGNIQRPVDLCVFEDDKQIYDLFLNIFEK